MYELDAFGSMINDQVRMNAYAEALRRTITPDSVVLDVGSGTGIMALLAARFGAERVYAVESNPLVNLGARLAAENGLSDRIRFVRGLSQQIELTRKVDVVVSDLRGALPLSSGHIEAIVDARNRLLRPGGTMIPLEDRVYIAPIEAAEAHSGILSPWLDEPHGFQMTAAEHAALNAGLAMLKSYDQLLGPGQMIATLDYRVLETLRIDSRVTLPIVRSGLVHGLSAWFDAELVRGVRFSTAPDKAKTVYGRRFFPLTEPVAVHRGDEIRARIKADQVGGKTIWMWRGRVVAADGETRASFELSNVFYNPASPMVREVFGPDCVPVLSGEGRIIREILDGIDGIRTLGSLAAEIASGHPGRFEVGEEALAFVRDVAESQADVSLRLDD